MTRAELSAFLARSQKPKQLSSAPPADREDGLHKEILEECVRRGWLVLHGSMAHRTHRTVGEPDFVILCDGGRTLFIEAKAKAGKPSKEQLALAAWARKLGHEVFLCRNLADFLIAAQSVSQIKSV